MDIGYMIYGRMLFSFHHTMNGLADIDYSWTMEKMLSYSGNILASLNSRWLQGSKNLMPLIILKSQYV